MHPEVARVTAAIVERSADKRAAYLARVEEASKNQPGRGKLSCANWAHAFAAAPAGDKLRALDPKTPNIGIVTAYNDMLSAHQPYERYPALIREAARGFGATAEVAGGTPAMCDGVTQGRPGMELSLFSREVIALSTGVALTHDAFDAALLLGICDKIVPGLLIGALTFGHLPAIFVPSGPMSSGLSNAEKAKTRALYAEGKVGRDELLASEQKSYHGPGTCTFYGTANSNQMLMECMGLHMPGAAFVPPDTPLRDALTVAAVKRATEIKLGGNAYTPIGHVIDEKALVNGVVGLLATGGSTNHTLHLVAAAAAAGIDLRWEDIDALSRVTPLIARVYPNGEHDVNRFQAAGGVGVVIREMLRTGRMHADVLTVAGPGLEAYAAEPDLDSEGLLSWKPAPDASLDPEVLASAEQPFQAEGGLRLAEGGLGRAVIKTSAVKPQHRQVDAPCVVFDSQDEMIAAFSRGDLDGRDLVAVVRFQGPAANGMPELHNLTPALSVLLDRGHRVALVTDGRMSGASGKVAAAIHVTPEAARGGPLARLRTGDRIRVDLDTGELALVVDEAEFAGRDPATAPPSSHGYGRELFTPFRSIVSPADQGASIFTQAAA